VHAWDEIAHMPLRRIVGLMSGTSVDGVDAALVEVSGTGPTLRLERIAAALTLPYDAEERARIHALFDGRVADICEMNVILGERFAEAALAVIAQAGLAPEEVHLVGSHGQTIYHVPRGRARRSSTLQIGEPCVIAERTGITTVADFRPRDIAAGGEGAPLVPYVDWVLCHRPDRTIALQNIGGIANVTVVTPMLEDVIAFDTGPGNMVIDAAAERATGGRQTYDEDGRLAASHVPNQRRVAELLRDPYFALPIPKSTGREYWGRQYVERLAPMYTDADGAVQLVSDLTEFAARSIRDAYAWFIFPQHRIDAVYLSGGGARNPVLRRRLAELFAPVPVGSTSDLDLPGEFKEAVAFAILANETICGQPSSIPGATGATGPRVLGKIIPGRDAPPG